ncbi:hypothetical protein [Pseudothermotoga thermarum]|uniref:Uncharacterized protein n=1 Tax=Pseudothermotoga thermarum DSM 5069 TaxID=688269 RepID=F7YW56_9THEM|nr:hypothetical protein [Pseudothermotoga thermarum]AEH50545.1 hypothetical protein Theth_0452 [Pseudothermotoga thermarum DSM 5069]
MRIFDILWKYFEGGSHRRKDEQTDMKNLQDVLTINKIEKLFERKRSAGLIEVKLLALLSLVMRTLFFLS